MPEARRTMADRQIDALSEAIGELRADMRDGKASRAELKEEVKDLRISIGEISASLHAIRAVSDSVTELRRTTHDRNNDIQTKIGKLDEKIEDRTGTLNSRVANLEQSRAVGSGAARINRGWWAALLAATGGAATIALSKAVDLITGPRPH